MTKQCPKCGGKLEEGVRLSIPPQKKCSDCGEFSFLDDKPKSKDVIEEIVKSVTREDGLLDIGKYDHELLEDLLIKAMQARDVELLEWGYDFAIKDDELEKIIKEKNNLIKNQHEKRT